MEPEVNARLDRLEAQLRVYRFGVLALVLIALAAVAAHFLMPPASGDVIRARGLIIEDAMGRPRIAMGAPLEGIAGRSRSDGLTGIVYIDENGADRLTFGRSPDPMTAEGIKPRRVGSAGILIHDTDGIERGGYSVLDDDTALLTIDWPGTGEAAVMSSGHGFSGIALFHRSELGVYREAITLGVHSDDDSSFAKITDAAGVERLRLATSGTDEPVVRRQGADGQPGEGEP